MINLRLRVFPFVCRSHDAHIKSRLNDSMYYITLHYITLEAINSGLSKNNFKDHYGDAATENNVWV